jgi:hypothetical protein
MLVEGTATVAMYILVEEHSTREHVDGTCTEVLFRELLHDYVDLEPEQDVFGGGSSWRSRPKSRRPATTPTFPYLMSWSAWSATEES